MPNNKNERKGKQAGELSAEERFRNFFSTSVIDLPEEMTRRDEPAPVEEKPKAGLLGKLFGHDKEETPVPAQPVQPTSMSAARSSAAILFCIFIASPQSRTIPAARLPLPRPMRWV